MKNLHILPTDKPSRLRIHECGQLFLSVNFIYEINDENKKHIYITSDEEITRNDYWLNVDNNTISNGEMFELANDAPSCKKIILTTDQDLIKDGVQAIDDEFLEWFVKNPNCEEVGVNKEKVFSRHSPLDKLGSTYITYKIIIPTKVSRCCGRCNGVDDLCYSDMTCDNHKELGCEICYGKRVQYNIIIPKEEPQERLRKVLGTKHPKQETLEEETLSRIKFVLLANNNAQAIRLLEQYAEFQKERSYSEEEVKLLVNKAMCYVRNDNPKITLKELKEWFEQFKKK